ncbi:hypothetical protein LJB74_04755 [Cellulomonas sp. P24]|nr:hypothetical protein [Cellulomonas sp. P24]
MTALYRGVLGRDPGPSEVSWWSGTVTSQGTFSVTLGFWRSWESALQRVNAAYQVYLGRSADPSGLSSWAPVLLAQGEGQLRSALVGSLEYWNRAQTRFP